MSPDVHIVAFEGHPDLVARHINLYEAIMHTMMSTDRET